MINEVIASLLREEQEVGGPIVYVDVDKHDWATSLGDMIEKLKPYYGRINIVDSFREFTDLLDLIIVELGLPESYRNMLAGILNYIRSGNDLEPY